jgi:hypothetical protein
MAVKFVRLLVAAVLLPVWLAYGPMFVYELLTLSPVYLDALVVLAGALLIVAWAIACFVRRRRVYGSAAVAAGTARLSKSSDGLVAEYGSAEFAQWIECLAAPAAPIDEMKALAASMWPQWASGPSSDAWPLARHEASHAVVAHHLGCVLLSVSVVPDADTAGRARYFSPRPALAAQDEAWVQMCNALAGLGSDRPAGQGVLGSASDMEKVAGFAVAIIAMGSAPRDYDGPLTVDRLVSAAQTHIAQILTEHQSEVEALAAALVDSKTLHGSAARSIIAAAGGANTPAAL